MYPDNTQSIPDEVGYLVVKVSTARGAIPLDNAAVSIRGNTPQTSGIVYSLRTDRDGITEKIALPAPARALSESPGNLAPFSTWNLDVFKEGYIPASFQNVPVYSSVVSVQPAVLVPIPQKFLVPEVYNETTDTEL